MGYLLRQLFYRYRFFCQTKAKIFILPLWIALIIAACALDKNSKSDSDNETEVDPFEINRLLAPGINIGNALEAPTEGEWGVTIEDEYFTIIKNAGFKAVRLPIRWSAHAAIDTPFTIDPLFQNRVAHVVNVALQQGLAVIINIHHYDEIFQQPAAHKARLLGLWQQIAENFKDYPGQLLFEILNEPHDNLTATLWNQYLLEALAVIRTTNPHRTVIIGAAEWGGLGALDKLSLPATDTNLIVTVHYYEPFAFTHQGAEWVSGSNAWLGTTWSATVAQTSALIQDFDRIKAWADDQHRPVFIGEFGAYSKADMTSRMLWTGYVVSQCRQRNFSWAYWEFCAGFGAYDPSNKTWRQPLLNALIQTP